MAGIMQIGGREQFHKYCPLVLKGENDLPCVKKYNTFMFWVPAERKNDNDRYFG